MSTLRQTLLPRSTLLDFAREHGLEIEVVERRKAAEWKLARFYAHFVGSVEVKGDGGVLMSVHGNGATPEEALAALASRVSEERLVVDAMRETRREIVVPVLTGVGVP